MIKWLLVKVYNILCIFIIVIVINDVLWKIDGGEYSRNGVLFNSLILLFLKYSLFVVLNV